MRDVHDHPQAVHFPYHVPAERRESVVDGLVGCRVGPVIGLEMRQGHITNAQPVIIAQKTEAVGNQVSAFEAEQGGNSPCTMNPHDIVRAVRDFHVARVSLDFTVESVDPFQCAS